MRIYKSYTFFVGQKLQFDALPDIVENYLNKCELSYKHFLYYLTETDYTDYYRNVLDNPDSIHDPDGYRIAEAKSYLKKTTGCRRAHSEHPELGQLRKHRPDHHDEYYLSNLDAPSKEARNAFFPIISKIYRRYGIDYTMIVYHGVDFFKTDSPCGISQENGIHNNLTGARIELTRERCFEKDYYITIHIDITDNYDASFLNYYRDAMVELLPAKVRIEEKTYCVLSDDESKTYLRLQKKCLPIANRIAEEIRKYVTDRVANVEGNPTEDAVSLAPALKKAAKAYGYTYLKPYYRFYEVVKKTPNSHILRIEMETGRYGNEFNVYMGLLGAGFDVKVIRISFAPSRPEEVNDAVFVFFEAVKSVYDGAFAELDSSLPESPENYISTFTTC